MAEENPNCEVTSTHHHPAQSLFKDVQIVLLIQELSKKGYRCRHKWRDAARRNPGKSLSPGGRFEQEVCG